MCLRCISRDEPVPGPDDGQALHLRRTSQLLTVAIRSARQCIHRYIGVAVELARAGRVLDRVGVDELALLRGMHSCNLLRLGRISSRHDESMLVDAAVVLASGSVVLYRDLYLVAKQLRLICGGGDVAREKKPGCSRDGLQ